MLETAGAYLKPDMERYAGLHPNKTCWRALVQEAECFGVLGQWVSGAPGYADPLCGPNKEAVQLALDLGVLSPSYVDMPSPYSEQV